MKIQLHDNNKHLTFAPLTLTRPVGNIRLGIFTNDERWKKFFPNASIFFQTEEYLNDKFKSHSDAICINSCFIPNEELAVAVSHLSINEELRYNGEWVARIGEGDVKVEYSGKEPIYISERWDLFQKNAEILIQDFNLITNLKNTVQLSSTNTIIGNPNLIFLEKGAKVEASILNTQEGPIYIGKDAEIMEGSIVRGPLALCEKSVLKLGSKVYGGTTLGPYCKVGGEVNNVIFQGYSNKGHDGFIGNSFIGEWCNIGADTNASNLKNNYGEIKIFSYEKGDFEQTSLQFMGIFMGDHSKCSINTMFNTATVIGVSCNIFGSQFPPKYISSFTWGMERDVFQFDKAIQSANNMMRRRDKQLDKIDISILKHISVNSFSNKK
ncbi:MAG: glucose-1-phosphate thymidylyltransferase [Crocinitomicaceae bacterium]|nr:glucose-1-phosphate thymidylyltransferase [Crocinitomicaceae bacterium]|tara:strand:+ start:9041 stop:10183 length:1143 start_codon:yes stop_codon:yes gene_type:complete